MYFVNQLLWVKLLISWTKSDRLELKDSWTLSSMSAAAEDSKLGPMPERPARQP